MAQEMRAITPRDEAIGFATVPRVSVIMAAYNEEDKIAECVRLVGARLENLPWPYEIVVVDDGSTDATRREARKLGDSHVRVVGYSRNRGKGFAIKYGARHVTGDVVVFTDSDGNIRPDLIGQYVSSLRDNDMAIASKRHPDSRVSVPLLRRCLSYGFHCLVMLLTGVRVSDTQSGFKAFRREALVRIMALVSVKHYAFDVELLTVAKLLKLRVVELPVNIHLRSLFGTKKMIRMFVDLLGIAYRLRVIRWYQKNLQHSKAVYEAIVRW
jgi:glycosyltransferase involved in cell wall biosynthesis